MSSNNGAAAFNASVRVNDQPDVAQRDREQRAIDCQTAVEAIEAKLAGLQTALVAAKTEAVQARAEARNGRN